MMMMMMMIIIIYYNAFLNFSLQEVDAKPQSLLIEYIKENSWVKILQAYLGAYGLVKVLWPNHSFERL